MKLINSKAEIIPQGEGIEGVYRQIEVCGRTCYKSEDKMTDTSSKAFVDRMIASNHTAMLEQGTVYLKIPCNWLHRLTHIGLCSKYIENPYSRTHEMYEFLNTPMSHDTTSANMVPYLAVTTNLRVLVENDWLEDLKYICEPTQYHEKRYTMRFTTDRGVMAELTRHRAFSFSVESTRYCNYSRDKFDNEITFINPSWLNLNKGKYQTVTTNNEIQIVGDGLVKGYYDKDKEATFLRSCLDSESDYMNLIDEGCSPQEARQVLPNALKTEVCMTGFASDWRFFFDLRFYGETGKPHPDMELLASKARSEFVKAGLWDNILACPTKFDKDDTEGKD